MALLHTSICSLLYMEKAQRKRGFVRLLVSFIMHPDHKDRRRLTPPWRAVIENRVHRLSLYSNLLMGEFTATNGPGKTLAFALERYLHGYELLHRDNLSALIGICCL